MAAVNQLYHRAAREEDLAELFKRMRPRDRDEAEAAAGDVQLALARSFQMSEDPIAVCTPDERLIAVFGLSPVTLLSDTGSPWLLGTELMQPFAKGILHDARNFITFARERYPRLMNYVDARNGPSIRWLRRLGFVIEKPVPFGVSGLPFHRFTLGFDDV